MKTNTFSVLAANSTSAHTSNSAGSVTYDSPDETHGGKPYRMYGAYNYGREVVSAARATAKQCANAALTKTAEDFLSKLESAISDLATSGVEPTSIPKLRATNLDEQSLLFEWGFEGFRIGFSIESDPQNSSWYFVTSKELGDTNASGFLNDTQTTDVLHSLLHYLVTHI